MLVQNCKDCMGEQVLSHCVNIAKNTKFKSTNLTELVEEIGNIIIPTSSTTDVFNGKGLLKDDATQAEKNQYYLYEIEGLKKKSSNFVSEKIKLDMTTVNSTLTLGEYTIGEILLSAIKEIGSLKSKISELENNNVY